jgi:branched-chain amino acid transport system substrate-binding protein
MNPDTHQLQQTVYLARANPGAADGEDAMFEIVSMAAPEDVVDTAADAACKLESFEDTPVTEP